jgi:hypothetical protein
MRLRPVVRQRYKAQDIKTLLRRCRYADALRNSGWPHSKGDGFDVVIDEQISVTGRITCRAAKDGEAAAE